MRISTAIKYKKVEIEVEKEKLKELQDELDTYVDRIKKATFTYDFEKLEDDAEYVTYMKRQINCKKEYIRSLKNGLQELQDKFEEGIVEEESCKLNL